MKTNLTPYLSFKGNCREAMTFYAECLGAELSLQTVGESAMAEQWPADAKNKILHASLKKETLFLLGSDMGDADLLSSGAVSLALGCANEDEINLFFEKLSSGGKITHQLHTFYNGTIGAFTDKYGMNWILKL